MNRLYNFMYPDVDKCSPEIYFYDTPLQRRISNIPLIGVFVSLVHSAYITIVNVLPSVDRYELLERKITCFTKILDIENKTKQAIIQRYQQPIDVNDTVITILKRKSKQEQSESLINTKQGFPTNSFANKEKAKLKCNVFHELLKSTKQEIIKCNALYQKTIKNLDLLLYYRYSLQRSYCLHIGFILITTPLMPKEQQPNLINVVSVIALKILFFSLIYGVSSGINNLSQKIVQKIESCNKTLKKIDHYTRYGPSLNQTSNLI